MNAPDLLAKIDLGYDDGSFFAKVSASYTGKRYFSYLENAEAPSYTVVDLSAGYRFHGSPLLEGVEIQANITNVTDETYISTVGTNGFNTASDNQTPMIGAPIQGFITVRRKFSRRGAIVRLALSRLRSWRQPSM